MKNIANICLCILLVSCSLLDIDDIPLTEGEIPFKLPPGVYTDVDGEKHNTSDERWSISEEELFKGVIEEDDKNLWVYVASILAAAGLGAGAVISKKKSS